MVDNKDISLRRNMSLGSYFKILALLVIHYFEKLPTVIGSIREFEMKSWD